MSNTYSFKRRAMFVVTTILATLSAAIMAQPANADHPREITTIALAETYFMGRVFLIDTLGLVKGEYQYILQITDLDVTNGRLLGKYYPFGEGEPDMPNVTGLITIVSIVRGGRSRGITTRISFTVGANKTVPGLSTGGTEFEGAIRFPSNAASTDEYSFMAGTFRILSVDGSPGSTGPFPFKAKSAWARLVRGSATTSSAAASRAAANALANTLATPAGT